MNKHNRNCPMLRGRGDACTCGIADPQRVREAVRRMIVCEELERTLDDIPPVILGPGGLYRRVWPRVRQEGDDA